MNLPRPGILEGSPRPCLGKPNHHSRQPAPQPRQTALLCATYHTFTAQVAVVWKGESLAGERERPQGELQVLLIMYLRYFAREEVFALK